MQSRTSHPTPTDFGSCPQETRAQLTRVIAAHLLRDVTRNGAIPGHDVDDLIQDVWVVLYQDDARQLRAHDPMRSSLAHYVGMIARRTAYNRRRAARVRRRPVEMPESSDPTEAVIARDLLSRVYRHLMACLPTRGFAVFEQLYVKGRSPGSAAQALGVERQVVYNWQRRIRAEAVMVAG